MPMDSNRVVQQQNDDALTNSTQKAEDANAAAGASNEWITSRSATLRLITIGDKYSPYETKQYHTYM